MADKSVPIVDPTGQVRMIPAGQVDAAIAAGGKHAIKMTDPKGTARWVPEDQMHAAIAAGGKVAPEQSSGAMAFLKNFADSSGLSALAHPINTVEGIPGAVKGMYENAKEEGGAAVDAAKQGQYGAAAAHAVQAIPIVGQVAKAAGEEIPSTGDNSYGGLLKAEVTDPATMGTIAGAAASPAVAEGVGRVAKAAAVAAPNLSNGANAMKLAKERFNQTAYPKPMAATPEEMAGQNLVKAMVPDEAAVPNIKSASSEVGDAVAAANRKGLPINSKLDAAKALKDRAADIQAHYSDNLLRPHSGKFQTVPENYNGELSGNGKNQATLGQINDRVDAINRELKSNFRKKLNSQTTEANASDADLLAEKQQLTKTLHGSLADMNGLQPEDIADVRQRAGKLRTLGDEMESSANKDTIQSGKRLTGATLSPFKSGIESASDKLFGSPEVVGNRSIKEALGNFDATEKPLPQPVLPDPTTTPTTPEAAQTEALHAHQLDQAAQDAAAARGGIANEAREGNRAASFQARTGRPSPVDKDVVTKTMTQPSPTAGQTTPPIALPPPSADVAPPTAAPTPGRVTTESKQVVAPDAARGVQSVNMDVTSPATHIFSKSAAAKAAPGTDVNAAAAAAKADGYEVVE